MLIVGLGEDAPAFVGRVEELAALDAAFERPGLAGRAVIAHQAGT